MKRILLVSAIFLLLLLFVFWSFSQYRTGDGSRAEILELTGNVISDFEKDATLVNDGVFEFEGYAVGKSHVGTFSNWEGYLIEDSGGITGIGGSVQANSVTTGIGKLDTHLKSDDFFDVEKYPEIKFASTEIDSAKGEITGNLEFRGVIKKINFPASIDENSISAEFFLDTGPFNFKYIGVNKEVRIKFEFIK
jgi:polyisoprenoid-binding protein YceI